MPRGIPLTNEERLVRWKNQETVRKIREAKKERGAMNNLWKALEDAAIAWRTWSETNYNTRDESFQAVIFSQSKVQACYDALKDTGMTGRIHRSEERRVGKECR